MVRLIIIVAILALPLFAYAEEVGKKSINILGEMVTLTISTEDHKTFFVDAGHLFSCRSSAHGRGANSLVFNECTNGWTFSSGEFQGVVLLSVSGSRGQEAVPDDSGFAWWHRTVMRNYSGH